MDLTATEARTFREALTNMDVLYAHDLTLVLRVDTEPPASALNDVPYKSKG